MGDYGFLIAYKHDILFIININPSLWAGPGVCFLNKIKHLI